MAKPRESLTITPIDDPGNPHFTIKGSTLAIKDALLQGGAIWQGSQLFWLINGSAIPKSIEEAVGEAYGLFGLPKHPAAKQEVEPIVQPNPTPVLEDSKPETQNGGICSDCRVLTMKSLTLRDGGRRCADCDAKYLSRLVQADTKTKVQSGQTSIVYATRDIPWGIDKSATILAGTQGKVEAGGEGRISVTFEGFARPVACDWDMITTHEPVQKTHKMEDELVEANKPGTCHYEELPATATSRLYMATHSATIFGHDGSVQQAHGYFDEMKLFIAIAPGWSMWTREQWESRTAKLTEIRAKLDTSPSFKMGQFVWIDGHYPGVICNPNPHFGIVFVNVADPKAPNGYYSVGNFVPEKLGFRISSLPERQVEFLQDLAASRAVKKNAATRMALRRYGMITLEDQWDKITITDVGLGWLENFGQVLKQAEKPVPEVDYSIEARYGVEQGDDWLGWILCCQCGTYLDSYPNRKAQPAGQAKVLVYSPGLGHLCDDCRSAVNVSVAKQHKPQEAPKLAKPVSVRKSSRKPVKTPSESKVTQPVNDEHIATVIGELAEAVTL